MTDTLILSVKLLSGDFETSLRIPLIPRTKLETNEIVSKWLEMIQMGFRIGAENMSATIAEPEAAPARKERRRPLENANSGGKP